MTGRPTYASRLIIDGGGYGLKINHADFSERLGTDKQFLER